MKVGVLALQGAFVEHGDILERLGAEVRYVRLAEQLDGLDAAVIPGGESTTIALLLFDTGLHARLKALGAQGLPLFGTCAGLIVLARRVPALAHDTLGLLDVNVERNAFGRQVDSFETDLSIDGLAGPAFRGVFIRAPKITAVGAGVEVLARLRDGAVVAVREGRILATAFHPELTDDPRLHGLFLDIVSGRASSTSMETAPAAR